MFAHQNSWHSHSVRRIIRHHSTLPEQFSVFTGKQGSFHPYSSLFTPICFDSSPNKIPKEQCKLYTLAPKAMNSKSLKTTWCYISIWGFLKTPKLVVSPFISFKFDKNKLDMGMIMKGVPHLRKLSICSKLQGKSLPSVA